jgi:glycyl-tRNA synthetase
MAWYVDLGINPERLRIYEHPKEKLSHYSKRTADIEYKFEFAGTEWGELEGVARRAAGVAAWSSSLDRNIS